MNSSINPVPAIEIRDLVKTYNGVKAVDGLSVTVPQGCFFGFLGPNGAGKTTTIKMLMGLAQPTSGTIQVMGLGDARGVAPDQKGDWSGAG